MLKIIIKQIVFAIILTTVLWSRHAGFILVFAAIIVLPLVLKDLVFLVLKKGDLVRRKSFIIVATLSLVGPLLWHVYLHEGARNSANAVATKLLSYKKANGVYPSPEEFKVISGQIGERRLFFYSLNDGEPSLSYFATWVIYDTYDYDFKNQSWSFNAS